MKSLKKVLAILLSLVMVFSAVAVSTAAGAKTADEETDNTYSSVFRRFSGTSKTVLEHA